jgi:predicted RNA-binding Zn-ribbon protein involved in translation (DUF1610 family)
MKSKNTVGRIAKLLASLGLGVAVFGFLASTPAFGQAKGGQKQLELSGTQPSKLLETTADLEKLQPGDMVVMSCPKCKSVAVTHVTTEKGHIKRTTVGEKHLCPGCGHTAEIVGHGKGKVQKLTHVCAKCGSEDAYCCVVKKGSEPTKGMEKK